MLLSFRTAEEEREASGAGSVLGLMAKDGKRMQKNQYRGQGRGLALGTGGLAGALAAECCAIEELVSVPEPWGARLAAAVEGKELPHHTETLLQQKAQVLQQQQ